MYNAAKIIFLFTFLIAAESVDHSSGHDITTLLANSVVKIFKSVSTNGLANVFAKLFTIKANNLEITTAGPLRVKPFDRQNKFFIVEMELIYGLIDPELYYNFIDNELSLFGPGLCHINYRLKLGANPNSTHCSFFYSTDYQNVSVNAIKVASKSRGNKFKTDFSFDHFVGYVSGANYPQYLTEYEKDYLRREITAVLPSVIRNSIVNSSGEFCNSLNKSHLHRPKRDIILTYSRFLTDEQKFYYFIPKAFSSEITSYNITFRGLSNFETLKVNHTCAELLISNIQGGTNLCLGQSKQILKFEFYADYISMWMNIGNKAVSFPKYKSEEIFPQINVKLLNCTVTEIQTNADQLMTNVDPIFIIEAIEKAIKSSVMELEPVMTETTCRITRDRRSRH